MYVLKRFRMYIWINPSIRNWSSLKNVCQVNQTLDLYWITERTLDIWSQSNLPSSENSVGENSTTYLVTFIEKNTYTVAETG